MPPKLFFKNPANPLAHTAYGKSMAATMELFERSTRRYHRPEWGIESTTVGAEKIPVSIKTSGSARSVGCCISNAPSRVRRAARSRNC